MRAGVFSISGLYAISLASFGSIAGAQSSGVEQGSADRVGRVVAALFCGRWEFVRWQDRI